MEKWRTETLLAIALLLLAGSLAMTQNPAPTYKRDILPLLKGTCSPCHFPNGKIYHEYPFDQYSIVVERIAGIERRLKDPSDRKLFRNWVESGKPVE